MNRTVALRIHHGGAQRTAHRASLRVVPDEAPVQIMDAPIEYRLTCTDNTGATVPFADAARAVANGDDPDRYSVTIKQVVTTQD